MTATDVVDKRIKISSPRKIYLGFPGSTNFVIKPAGWVTPNVWSYVMQNGVIYWMFDGATPEYMEHNPNDELQSGWGSGGYTDIQTDKPLDFGIDLPVFGSRLVIPPMVYVAGLAAVGLWLFSKYKR